VAKSLRITYKRSIIGRPKKHKVTLRTLGLRRLNQTRTFKDSPAIRGMIRKVGYLLRVEVISDETS